MKNEIFEHTWEIFKQHNVPEDAGPNQVRQTKQAFYAGAHVMADFFQTVSAELEEGEAIRILDSITTHIQAWIEEEAEAVRKEGQNGRD